MTDIVHDPGQASQKCKTSCVRQDICSPFTTSKSIERDDYCSTTECACAKESTKNVKMTSTRKYSNLSGRRFYGPNPSPLSILVSI